MAVLSKVLYGELSRISIDICGEMAEKKPRKNSKNLLKSTNSIEKEEKKKFIGNIVKKNMIKSGDIIRLSPFVENVHYLKAKTDCIFFDILMPNYDNSYRMCHFYKEIEVKRVISKKILEENGENGEEKIFLEEIEEPPELESFIVVGFPRFLSLKL